MKVLSQKLQSKIQSRPTQTILKSDNEKLADDFVGMIRTVDKKLDWLKIPREFNGREVWGDLLTPVKNQGSCGSCWAFASSSTLADKFNIQSMGAMNIDLSASKIILCDFTNEKSIAHPDLNEAQAEREELDLLRNSACYGNSLFHAWRYLYIVGTNTEECVPYDKKYGLFNELDNLSSFQDSNSIPLCSQVTGILGDMCSDFTFNDTNAVETGTPARFYKCLHYYSISGTPENGGDQTNIQYDIYRWGPVSSAFKVYPDFYTFDAKNEVYEWNGEGPQVGGHAIEIVGWGETVKSNGEIIPWWLIKNSWGVEWGDKGYFKMIRGKNNCELEENCISGIPDYFYPVDYELPGKDIEWVESEDSVNKRRIRSLDRSLNAGGIDPETGYTRRVMVTKPWVDITNPFPLESVPQNLDKWAAGINSSVDVLNKKNSKFKWYWICIIILIILGFYVIKKIKK